MKKKRKVHYAKYPRATYSVCGLYTYGNPFSKRAIGETCHYMLRLTRRKSKVTCKNCHKAKRYYLPIN